MATAITFETTPLEALHPDSFDAVSLVDVLYAVRHGEWPTLLNQCYRVLKPRGILLIKEVINRPRWAAWLVQAQEVLALKVLRITQGDWPHLESEQTYYTALTQAGFEVHHSTPLPTWGWTAHWLLIGQKPLVSSALT